MLSIGAALQDVFLGGEIFTAHRENGHSVEEFVIGEKYEVDTIEYAIGGGATNAAVTFARQGFDSVYMGNIGRDPAGAAVIEELKRNNVKTEHISYSEDHATGYSVVLLAPDGGRTILIYRGASSHFDKARFKLNDVQADWFYVSTLSGDIELLEAIVNNARDRHIKVALNPGEGELLQKDRLLEIVKKVNLLCVNREEGEKLFGPSESQDLVKEAVQFVPTVVVTDGKNGVVAADRAANQLCRGGMYEDVPVVDRTGAGDAFSSGFTAKIAMGAKLADAIVFASANATSVVSQIGAKAGILTVGAELHGMDMQCEPL